MAREFLQWLNVPPGRRWLDVGCGTGVLTRAILAAVEAGEVVAVDSSAGFLEYGRAQTADPRVDFQLGDGRALPFDGHTFDVAVAGLVLNFVPEALSEMRRVSRPGGSVAAYVWDYSDGMQMLRHFWAAAVNLDPAAAELDEGRRFPLCQAGALKVAFEAVGLSNVEQRTIEVPTRFAGFEDYWTPFLGGQGPAPSYVATLEAAHRDALRERLRSTLPTAADGSIQLTARAWAARGQNPESTRRIGR